MLWPTPRWACEYKSWSLMLSSGQRCNTHRYCSTPRRSDVCCGRSAIRWIRTWTFTCASRRIKFSVIGACCCYFGGRAPCPRRRDPDHRTGGKDYHIGTNVNRGPANLPIRTTLLPTPARTHARLENSGEGGEESHTVLMTRWTSAICNGRQWLYIQ